MLTTISAQNWDQSFEQVIQQNAINDLENGAIIYFPQLAFKLLPEENFFLSPDYADPDTKNIGFHPESNKLWGVQRLADDERIRLQTMLARFSQHAYGLINQLFPTYAKNLTTARTSYRPLQVSNRKTSYRKDDKRLHVDAFPSAPNQGKRILRVFSNINPHGEDRVWRVGESFHAIAQKFIPEIKKPIPGFAKALQLLNITKSYRTPYDHYMLRMHDKMKGDNDYQQNAPQQEVRFPPGSTWIVQTDHVCHAALQGQYVLEQTFSLPIHGMQDETKSPLRVLEKILNKKLV